MRELREAVNSSRSPSTTSMVSRGDWLLRPTDVP